MEKLSVIIPVYNTYQYLRECLDSIINQTYKNLEIIIVNDASPYIEDDEICKEYAQKDSRIIYIKHDENKKQGGARNTGIEKATGKYITFVDSDDFLIDLKGYEKCLEYFNETIDIVSFKFRRTIEDKEHSKQQQNKIIPSRYYQLGVENGENGNINGVIAWNKIFRIDKLKDNLYFQEKIKFEDIEFWYRLVICNKPTMCVLDYECYMYRNNTNSITNNMIKSFDDFIIILNIMYNVYTRNKSSYSRKYYLELINILHHIGDNLSEVDNKKYNCLVRDITSILKQIEITEEEFTKYLGYNFYENLFYDKYIYNMYLITSNRINYKYMFVKENIIIYKIKRETKRIIKQIKKFLKWKS